MKKLLVTLAAVLVSVSAFAQGTINFNNRGLVDPTTGASYDQRVTGITTGATAQLFLVGAGGVLTPLTPSTTFRTGAGAPFVNAVSAVVTGQPAGTSGLVVRMRAWSGSSWETATARGESNDITLGPLGGVPPTPGAPPVTPPNLNGLQNFEIAIIPEPSTIALGVLGAAALLLRRRK